MHKLFVAHLLGCWGFFATFCLAQTNLSKTSEPWLVVPKGQGYLCAPAAFPVLCICYREGKWRIQGKTSSLELSGGPQPRYSAAL